MHDRKNPDNDSYDGWPEEVTISVSAKGEPGTSRHYECATFSIESLFHRLGDHREGEKDGWGWSPFDFRDDIRRAANSIGADFAVLDIDDGTSFDDIEAALFEAGIAALVVSSYSHLSDETSFARGKYEAWRKDNPNAADECFMRDHRNDYVEAVWRGSNVERGRDGAPIVMKVKKRGKIVEEITVRHAPCEKYRVVVPLTKTFLSEDHRDPDAAWETIVVSLARRLRLMTDPRTLDRAHMFFGPRHPADVEPLRRIVPGGRFDAEKALARAALRENSRAGGKSRYGAPLARQSGSAVKLFRGNIEALSSAVMAVPHDDNIDMWDWLAMIFAICEETDGSEEGNELAHEWSKTWICGYDYDETERVWRRAVRNLGKDMKKAAGGTIRQFLNWYAKKWRKPAGFEWGDTPTIEFENERLGTALAVVTSTLGLAEEGDKVRPNRVTDLDFIGRGGDIYNGATFGKLYRDRLLFIHETGDVLRFDPEGGWLAAAPGTAERAAKAVVVLLRDSAETDEARMRHVMRLCDARAQRAMIEMARSEPGMTRSLSEYDSDPMLLGVLNGVLDLRTGRLLPVSPDLLVSKRCNAAFDPDALCPRFERFMKEVQPDSEVREFLQRFAGYCLTGDVSEQVFAIFHGGGKNGKSVFIEILGWLLGDYAKKIPTELLMHHQRNPQGASPEIVALKGLRLAFANETEEGRRLAEARVKDLTGGDTLTGRRLYSDDISFRPSHKLIIVGNHKPEIADMSAGMWRRIALTPWGQTIPERDRDLHLPQKLKKEGSGILNWALHGLREWQEIGLRIPKTIKDATAGYREDEDIIGEFIAERCKVGKGLYESKATVFADYRDWAEENGHRPPAQSRFTKRLLSRGFALDGGKRNIEGLALSVSSSRDRPRRRF